MNEKETLLINDILNSCPETPEHQFTPYYIRQRNRNINTKIRKVKKIRKKLLISAAAAVMLLAVMGFHRITFMNGFRITENRTFLQLTQYLVENAPEKIEKSPYITGEETYSCTITLDTPEMRKTEYRSISKTVYLTQYTVEKYNEDMTHWDTSHLEYEMFSAGDKAGIFNLFGGRCYVRFQYGGYVFEADCKGDISEITGFIESLTF